MSSDTVELAYRQLLNEVKIYTDGKALDLLERAYIFAREKHEGQYRASGEPYIIHPIEVAKLLTVLKVDVETLAAALLHDVLEDTDTTYDQLVKYFGERVAKLVFGVTKLTSLSKLARESLSEIDTSDNLLHRKELQIRNLRKLLVRTAEDIRVLILKLADRLHNMRTLTALPLEKRQRIALETLKIFAPLSHRLGIWVYKRELEDLAFRELYPEEYALLDREVKKRFKQVEPVLDEFRSQLLSLLSELEPKITYRLKGLYSIFDKMQRKGLSLEQVYDILAFRILVRTVPECYTALGLIHQQWVPLPNRIKDYIAKPKPNGYRSLHTTVYASSGLPVEVQIRTYEMHLEAEHGVAAHWAYKLGERPSVTQLKRYQERLADLVRSLDEAVREGEFEAFQEELSSSVIVFTPRGECIELPRGSTPIDFAYKIHTYIGDHCSGARVNGRLVSLSYELRDGDIVEIITSKSASPNLDWLNFVRTSHARAKIKSYFKRIKRDEYIRRAKEMIARELPEGTELDQLLKETYERYYRKSYARLEDMLVNIGFGDLKLQSVLDKLRLILRAKTEPHDISSVVKAQPAGRTRVETVSTKGMLVRTAKCCMPVRGDDIIGFITLGKGISIHRRDCKNLQHLLRTKPELRKRLIELTWDDIEVSSTTVRLRIKALDRKGLLRDIMEIISGEGINVSSVRGDARDNIAIIQLVLEINSSDNLNRLMRIIRTKLPEVISLKRV